MRRPSSSAAAVEVAGQLATRSDVVANGDAAVIGFGIERLRRARPDTRLYDPVRAWARLLTSLADTDGVDLALELAADPADVQRLAVTLFASHLRGDVGVLRGVARDLAELLAASEEQFDVVPLDAEQVTARRASASGRYTAAVRRREEALRGPRPVGFAVEPPEVSASSVRALWSFAEESRDPGREDLARALVSQDAPVSLRFIVRPTTLSPRQVREVDRRARALEQVGSPLAGAAARTLRALEQDRPLFELHVLVASPRPLRPACLSSIGFAVSPPRRTGDPYATLDGGFEVHHDTTGALARAFTDLAPPTSEDGDRLRHLMGPWAVAAVTHPPVALRAHFPGMAVAAPVLPASDPQEHHEGVVLGSDVRRRRVVLPHHDRMRHTHVLGQTGTGKSTLLLHMVRQDLDAGEGLALIDPHGDLVEAVLALVPEHRWDDVVLLDAADPVAVAGLNLLEADDDVQREYLISEMCSWMYALFDPGNQGIVGPRFEQMLRYSALLLMEDEQRWSFLEIPRLFADPAFTQRLVERSHDPLVVEFFRHDIGRNRSSEYVEMTSWFRSKFEPFRSIRPLRRMLGQVHRTVDLRRAMDERAIVLADLSKGRLGEYNARLLGFVVFARLWTAALSRASVPADRRVPFHIYLDEAQTVTTSSLPTILSEARKYQVSATLAHQFVEQLPEQLRATLLGNVGTSIAFRLGHRDAVTVADHLGPEVDARTLRTMPNFEALADVLVAGRPTQVRRMRAEAVALPTDAPARAAAVRARSRDRWAVAVEQLDADHLDRYRPSPTLRGADGASPLDQWMERRRGASPVVGRAGGRQGRTAGVQADGTDGGATGRAVDG